MNDVVIRARDLSKVYRLYGKPSHRVLDMLGLLPHNSKNYTSHAALDHFNLEVRRGEKVAIIGRNGAGKSTFLKLVSGVSEPTSGTLEVQGRVHALLNIGAAFHPEFTGRENARSYLAHLGVQEKDTDALIREIVDFAEIDEYIDQPVKTYSSGMSVRLMFAAATVIRPTTLVLDEVLSVGDGYFAKKSFDKMRELCEGEGTTLLLVSHDIYSAASLCDRFVWIEKGAVLLDGEPKTVMDRYEASIRDEHERRLRSLHLLTLDRNVKSPDASESSARPLFCQIRCAGNSPIDADLPIRRIAVFADDRAVSEIFPGKENATDGISLILDDEEGNWSPLRTIDGAPGRAFAAFGSIFHRAPFLVRAAAALEAAAGEELTMEIDFKDTATIPCIVEALPPLGQQRFMASLENTGSGNWISKRYVLRKGSLLEGANAPFPRYGTQALRIVDVKFTNAAGSETYVYETLAPMRIGLKYRIEAPDFRERPVVMITFSKNGTTRTNRFVLDDIEFDAARAREGRLDLLADPLLLAPGDYLVNIMIMREGAYGHMERNIFFTVNDQVLDCHSRAYEIKVVVKDDGPRTHNVLFVHPAVWTKDGI